MKLKIEVRSTRDELFIDTNKPFVDNIRFADEYYYFYFDLYFFKGKNQISEVHGLAFDEEANDDNDYAIGDIADDLSGDAGIAIFTMLQSDLYNDILLGSVFTNTYSVYIDKVYVDPEYRNKGIGKYILDNLRSILQHTFNISTRCFTIVPRPQIPNEEDEWENDPDINGEKRKIMIKVIEQAGYKQIEDTEVWANNCFRR